MSVCSRAIATRHFSGLQQGQLARNGHLTSNHLLHAHIADFPALHVVMFTAVLLLVIELVRHADRRFLARRYDLASKFQASRFHLFVRHKNKTGVLFTNQLNRFMKYSFRSHAALNSGTRSIGHAIGNWLATERAFCAEGKVSGWYCQPSVISTPHPQAHSVSEMAFGLKSGEDLPTDWEDVIGHP